MSNKNTVNMFKKLAKLMLGAFVFYLAGFITIWVIAVIAGAPVDITEWHSLPRLVLTIVGAPLTAHIWGHLLEAVDK